MYIGVDIGGSKILVVAGATGREITRQAKVETPNNAAQAITEIAHLIEQVSEGSPVKAIAVGAAGTLDRKRGILIENPNLGWAETPIIAQLKNHFKVPITLENDANVAGLAEAVEGTGQGYHYVLYVTVSTGVGTGIVINHEIYHGEHDTEGGHILIAAENTMEELEYAVSGPALKRRFGLYGYEITDPKMWDEFACDLAVGLYNFITLLSPSVVVIGGGVGVHFKKFEAPLLKHLQSLKPKYPLPPVVAARHIETAVAYGALILASRLKK